MNTVRNIKAPTTDVNNIFNYVDTICEKVNETTKAEFDELKDTYKKIKDERSKYNSFESCLKFSVCGCILGVMVMFFYALCCLKEDESKTKLNINPTVMFIMLGITVVFIFGWIIFGIINKHFENNRERCRNKARAYKKNYENELHKYNKYLFISEDYRVDAYSFFEIMDKLTTTERNYKMISVDNLDYHNLVWPMGYKDLLEYILMLKRYEDRDMKIEAGSTDSNGFRTFTLYMNDAFYKNISVYCPNKLDFYNNITKDNSVYDFTYLDGYVNKIYEGEKIA